MGPTTFLPLHLIRAYPTQALFCTFTPIFTPTATFSSLFEGFQVARGRPLPHDLTINHRRAPRLWVSFLVSAWTLF